MVHSTTLSPATKQSFGQWLRTTRKAKNVSAEALAKAANISADAVYQYERGDAFPRGKPHIIPAFEQVLGTTWTPPAPASTAVPASATPVAASVLPADPALMAKVLAEMLTGGGFELVIRPRT